MSFFSDTAKVFVRESRPIFYDPFTPVFSLAQPLVFLALLGPLVAATPGIPGESPWQWFVPGIVVMVSLFGTSMTGSNLQYEMTTGSHERIMVAPLNRAAIMTGKALKEIAPLVVQGAIIVLVMLPFGFRLYPLGALLGLAILAVLGIGLGALSYALALASQGKEWLFWGVQQTLLFPLLILSGMMLPLEQGPAWMRAVSTVNPLTYIVEAERTLFAGEYAWDVVGPGVVAAVATAAVGLTVGILTMRRQTV
ncbi:ABC-2 type transport system permease protein [Stackebrandtia albiflava]|uniref:Transport permease protein n=1 Tax=Stackebrandtia albiflava TaxID=406432 RepID=A0A562VA90_9ACTN|nr:ABC transporter permease [Stackebrandtia albiflava]TWJ14784.1 ABC-2 type transport system permease protein [Stackebrandtia albiflava]